MSAYTLSTHVCFLWPIRELLPNAAILVSIWEQARSIINIFLFMKDTVISPNETAWGGQTSMSSQSWEEAVAPDSLTTWDSTALFWKWKERHF